LEAARAALRVEVHRFLLQLSAGPGALHTHPVFGLIGAHDWERAHFKHVFHHLVQFGLVGAPG
jgi:hypothetical protein